MEHKFYTTINVRLEDGRWIRKEAEAEKKTDADILCDLVAAAKAHIPYK